MLVASLHPLRAAASFEAHNFAPRCRLEPADGDAGERPATPSSVSSSNSSFDRAAPSAQVGPSFGSCRKGKMSQKQQLTDSCRTRAQASLSRAGSAATQAESDVLLSRQNEELRAVLEAVTVEAESQKSISDITKQNLLQVQAAAPCACILAQSHNGKP